MEERIRKIFLFGGYVFVGLFATGASYWLSIIIVISQLEKRYGGSPESYLPVAFLGFLPFCFVLGGFVSGYLSQPFLKKKIINYVLISPAVYSSALLVVLSSWTVEGFFSFVIISSLAWNLFSIGGVVWGLRVRAKKIASSVS